MEKKFTMKKPEISATDVASPWQDNMNKIIANIQQHIEEFGAAFVLKHGDRDLRNVQMNVQVTTGPSLSGIEYHIWFDSRLPEKKIWLNDGSCAHHSKPVIVVAETAEKAVELLHQMFTESNGFCWAKEVTAEDMTEVDLDTEGVDIIDCDCL